MGSVIKNLIWLIVEAILFAWVIEPDCQGRVYGFGIALLVLNGLWGLTFLCQCCCGKRE